MERACCCVCRKNVPERKKRSLLFGRSERARVIRSSLLYYFKEERRQEVGDLKEVFPVGSYVCSDCSNIVEEYPKLRERCQYAERLLTNTATISSQFAHSPARARPPFPLAMSTPKRPRLEAGEQQQSPPLQVRNRCDVGFNAQ